MNKILIYLEDKKIVRLGLIFISGFFVVAGILLMIWYIWIVNQSHTIPKDGAILTLSSFGAFGDFIGGVVGTLFSLTGVFLLYITLNEQRGSFQRERLENNFFEMIKFHRENVNEMQYSYFEKEGPEKKIGKVTAQKRKVFKLIFVQFKELWEELRFVFDQSNINDIYEINYLEKIKRNTILSKRGINLTQLAQIDIVFTIIFFGLSKEDRQTILNIFTKKYKKKFIDDIIKIASLKPKRESDYWSLWEEFNEIDDKLKHFEEFEKKYINNYNKYYGGHQFRLGHYYRNFYQTVNLIDREKGLEFDEKYRYIKILRGQLSTYEQIIFFLNSISTIGRIWEIESKKFDSKHLNENVHLITKYNLIKNISRRILIGEIDLLKYYPCVEYESFGNNETVSGKLLRQSNYS